MLETKVGKHRNSSRGQMETAMTPTVEVSLSKENLADTMRQMRMWLDHRRVALRSFHMSRTPGGLIVQVVFDGPEGAREFCRHFSGRILEKSSETVGKRVRPPHAA
jgi:hypothetical protein